MDSHPYACPAPGEPEVPGWWRSQAILPGGPAWDAPVSRRTFLKLMGASLAMAGLQGCMPPVEKILPYVRAPEGLVPGKPLYFATAMVAGGYATGVLARSHMGRPTGIQGNPDHPASLGAADIYALASVLTLYDPDRSPALLHRGEAAGWDALLAELARAMHAQHGKQGAGLRILTGDISSPSLAQQLRELLARLPAARWYRHEPAGEDGARAGARLAFGRDLDTRYDLRQARVILSLDGDFLAEGPAALAHARAFAAGRRVRAGQAEMSRLYALESTPTLTGAAADHRLALRPSQVEAFARALAGQLGLALEPRREEILPPAQAAFLRAVAEDLDRHRGNCLVIPGRFQRPLVHALAHAINGRLGNAGTTVSYSAPVAARPPDEAAALPALAEDLRSGQVDALLILGGNPVYTAPADLELAALLPRAALSVHLGEYADETAAACLWHVPEAHYLESWGDARSCDGTVSIIQPLLAPLHDGKTAQELLAALAGQGRATGHDLLQAYWRGRRPLGFEAFWQETLARGAMAGTAEPTVQPKLLNDFLVSGLGLAPELSSGREPGLELIFRPDYAVWDGRYANNAWLQELPRPLTRITWDNPALLSPATAARFGLENGAVVELRCRGRRVEAPVWIMPGQADETVTVHLGYGRTRAGQVGTGVGFSAYALRTAAAPWWDHGLQIEKTGRRQALATTQHHDAMEGREQIQAASREEFLQRPGFARKRATTTPENTLYPPLPATQDGYAWGMSIDTSACIGCGACVVACQGENNIPVVGKEEVLRGREMHWLRVDRYYRGEADAPETCFQPVPCMHCENAPCEQVCPVGATVHSDEGLNEMVYNRCVGTRFCSNNCPYKVRRFNFFEYARQDIPLLKLLANPDVTVRSRGVMEKCTYCVQRIDHARIEAKEQGRPIRDGEVVTACQAACPAEAIVFGDLRTPGSRVARLKAEPHDYSLLGELNTRPRTTYLARIRNPNPELGES